MGDWVHLKKKITLLLVLLTLIITTIFGAIGWKNYTQRKAEEYLVRFTQFPKLGKFEPVTEDVTINRFIKRGPTELIFIIQWQDKKAYVTIENWLTRTHDHIEINTFDREKSLVMYE